MKLLIVEDDEDASSLMQFVLEQERFHVRSAADVGTAKGHLKEFTPDLIILDRGLPDANGLEFCRELKSLPRFKNIPVIFISSAKSQEEVAAGFAAGGDDYVTKPFRFVELIARVQAVLRRVRPTGNA